MKANHLALAGLFALSLLFSQALSRTTTGVDDDQPASRAAPPLGKRVTVHLRKDSLGMANSYGSSPVLESAGNVELSLTGILKHLNQDWLMLELNTGNYWIARDSILIVASDQ